ncbi:MULTISPECIES: anti-repressor SinI [Bacillus]|uniref:anti-repressor SinI n=1 Tax=Bacillus TaxID=1386 RepID=UPI00040E3C09|nr:MULTISPECIES: anti-repressor SinI family protein [Bacillus]QHZ47639.1 DNA-binding anti-repressor SinI [Bacillus sp. NSP9.1]WFA03693.1 anti-repressor SinI family protein [Bacillus sp. HSf4]
MNKDKNEKEEWDEEWAELIKNALKAGISPEEIRFFLRLGKKSSEASTSIERSHSINPF